MHPHCQSGFLLVKRLGSSDVLPACPPCFPRRCSAFAAKFKFKFGQAGEHPGNHAARGVGRVDAFPQGPEDDVPVPEVPNRGHHFGGISAKPVDSNHDNRIARPGL
jgi:hypothetical protein